MTSCPILLLLVSDTRYSSNVKHLEALPGPLPAVNQLELHPWCQQREIVDYCSKKGIVLQAFCPLVRIQKHKFEDPVIIKISKKHKRGEAHILLRWSLQKGCVTTSFSGRRNRSVWHNYQRFIPIPKASSAERIEANKDLYNFELDSEDMEELDGLDQGAAGRVSGIDPAHLPDWCAVRLVVSWCSVYIAFRHCFRCMFGRSEASTWSTWQQQHCKEQLYEIYGICTPRRILHCTQS